MSIRNEVIRLIEQENVHPITVTEDTDLYRDLHFDSLSFVSLLTKLEDRYHITIELFEMEQCLSVGTLIDMIEIKWKEKQV